MNMQATVKNKVISTASPLRIVCGNSDYSITFDFDAEWSNYPAKTARLIYRRELLPLMTEVAFTGNTVQLPPLYDINEVYVGVYAGDIHTTNRLRIECEKSILCGGGTHEDPPADVYEQLLELINNGDLRGATFVPTVDAAGNLSWSNDQGLENPATVNINRSDDFASAIKKTLTGAVVRADDVSTVTHAPAVWVHSENLIPYPYQNGSSLTSAGVTFTAQSDGGITVSGTPTAYVSFTLYNGDPIVKKGKITVSVTGTFANTNTAFVILDASGFILYEKELYANGANATINVEDYPAAASWLLTVKRGTNGVAMTGTVYPKIEIGDAATPYSAYIDPSAALVSRYGRNVLNMANSSKASCSINGNGVQANIEGAYYMELYANYLKAAVQAHDGKALTFSVGNVAADSQIAIVIWYTDGTYAQQSGTSRSVTLWLDHQGRTVQNVVVRPMAKSSPFTDTTTIIRQLMLEFGDTASPFEEYVGKGYTPAADGTVEGITSVAPGMTLLTDTAGLLVTCEYNVNTAKYIADMVGSSAAGGYLVDEVTGVAYVMKVKNGVVVLESVG